jgi:hypothetical protein
MQAFAVGNQGSFGLRGSTTRNSVKLAVLCTTGEEVDWPDALDTYTGTFTYYGDNWRPPSAAEPTRRIEQFTPCSC